MAKGFSNKLYKDIQALQAKSGYDFFKHGNRDGITYTIISINTKERNSTHPEALIKSASLDLSTGKLSYTTTQNIKEALKFNDNLSTMLYHQFERIAPEILDHSHYPIKK